MKPTIDFLMKRKAAVIGDLKFKVDVGDYHGVADCAMDLREIEAQIDVLKAMATDSLTCAHSWFYRASSDDQVCMICHEVRQAPIVESAEAKRRHVADWTVVE